MQSGDARRSGNGVLWAGAEAALSAAFSFASAFVVARIIGPQEVGIGAAAVAPHVFLWVGVNALFADALVQSPAVNREDASSAFWVSIGVGFIAGIIELALGWPIAASLGDSRLVAMSLALACTLPLVGAGGAIQGLLTRDRRYRALAGRALIGQGLGMTGGIACVLLGAGAWALVVQQVVTSALGALVLLLRAHWRPARTCRWSSVRALLRLGVPLTASTLVQQGRYRAFALLIGATAGAAALGQIHMAFRLVDTVRELGSTALWRLMLPAMARRQHDIHRLQETVDRSLALSALVLFPVIGALLATIAPAIALLLGPAWLPSGEAAAPLLFLMTYVFLSLPGGVAVVARGRPQYSLFANIGSTAATIAGVLLIRPSAPVAAAGIWLAAQLLVAPYSLLMTARVLHALPLRQWRAGLPALGLAALATGAAFGLPYVTGEPPGPMGLIVARLSAGALVYLPGALLLMRPSVDDAFRMLLPRVAARS